MSACPTGTFAIQTQLNVNLVSYTVCTQFCSVFSYMYLVLYVHSLTRTGKKQKFAFNILTLANRTAKFNTTIKMTVYKNVCMCVIIMSTCIIV